MNEFISETIIPRPDLGDTILQITWVAALDGQKYSKEVFIDRRTGNRIVKP